MAVKKISPVEFLDNIVLPRLRSDLPSVFPEFGWRKDSRGWIATNDEYTHSRLGVGADRVVCHGDATGLLIHGGHSIPWIAFICGDVHPTGRDFVEAVRKLAGMVGVDASPLDRELSAEEEARHAKQVRRGDLLTTFVEQAAERLRNPGPDDDGAREGLRYLAGRGLSGAAIGGCDLGYFPSRGKVRRDLEARGFSGDEIEQSGLLADGRWDRRVVCAVRDHRGRIVTVWARDIASTADEGAKYLYLKGGTKPCPIGLDVALQERASAADGLLVVEGVMDVVSLRAAGFPNVVAVGGDGKNLTKERWEELAALKVGRVVLLLDNDPKADGKWPGREGSLAAIRNAGAARRAPEVWVVDPAALGGHKDPDAFLRHRGAAELRVLLAGATSGRLFRLAAEIGAVTSESPERDRRDAVRRGLDYVASFQGEGAALDREEAILRIAGAAGYDLSTVEEEAETRGERHVREAQDRETKALLRRAQAEYEKPDRDVEAILGELADAAAAIRARTVDAPPAFSVDRLLIESKATPIGRSSGYAALDELEVSFNPGELAILAARTGHAKTTTLVNVMLNMIDRAFNDDEADEGVHLFYSFEEPEARVFHRLLSLWTASAAEECERWTVNQVRDFYRGTLDERFVPYGTRLDEAVAALRQWEQRFQVVYRPGWSVADVEAHALRVAGDRKVSAIFADYIQRITPPESIGKGRRRDEEVSSVARRLKSLAVATHAPVIAAAQINREAAKDAKRIDRKSPITDPENVKVLESRRPQLHQIREGGAEQEADLVLGLMNFRADFEWDDDPSCPPVPPVTRLDVGTLKHRYGAPGQWARLEFHGRYGLISDRRGGY